MQIIPAKYSEYYQTQQNFYTVPVNRDCKYLRSIIIGLSRFPTQTAMNNNKLDWSINSCFPHHINSFGQDTF